MCELENWTMHGRRLCECESRGAAPARVRMGLTDACVCERGYDRRTVATPCLMTRIHVRRAWLRSRAAGSAAGVSVPVLLLRLLLPIFLVLPILAWQLALESTRARGSPPSEKSPERQGRAEAKRFRSIDKSVTLSQQHSATHYGACCLLCSLRAADLDIPQCLRDLRPDLMFAV